MSRSHRTEFILALTGICILVISALLTLAIDQARNLVSLYTVSVAPTRATGVRNLWRLNTSLGSDVLIFAIVAALLFILVFRHPGRLLPLAIVAGLAFVGLNLYSGRHVLPQLLIWPSPVSLSEQYVEALAQDDLEGALRLTDRSEMCEANIVGAFQDHQARLDQILGYDWRPSDIQTTSVMGIRTFYDKPVPQGFVLMQPVPTDQTTIMVETEDEGVVWLSLKMSYKPFLGTRYICGYHIDSWVKSTDDEA